MEPVSEHIIICHACKAELAPSDTRCDRCGSDVTADATVEPDHRNGQQRRSLIDNPWVILGLMFGVALVLGLPFLWKSRGFSTLGKIVWTVIVSLYTILVFWLFWLLVSWCWGRISPFL
jgi:hypothetical protein